VDLLGDGIAVDGQRGDNQENHRDDGSAVEDPFHGGGCLNDGTAVKASQLQDDAQYKAAQTESHCLYQALEGHDGGLTVPAADQLIVFTDVIIYGRHQVPVYAGAQAGEYDVGYEHRHFRKRREAHEEHAANAQQEEQYHGIPFVYGQCYLADHRDQYHTCKRTHQEKCRDAGGTEFKIISQKVNQVRHDYLIADQRSYAGYDQIFHGFESGYRNIFPENRGEAETFSLFFVRNIHRSVFVPCYQHGYQYG